MCFPSLLLLSCLCFQRNRGVLESAGEGCSTHIWNNWGDITGDVCQDAASGLFPRLSGKQLLGGGRERLGTELRFYGGRKEGRETGVHCRGLDPSDGQLEPPRVNARLGPSGSVTDDRSPAAEVAMTPFVPTCSGRVHLGECRSAGLCARRGRWSVDARVLWTPFTAPSCP